MLCFYKYYSECQLGPHSKITLQPHWHWGWHYLSSLSKGWSRIAQTRGIDSWFSNRDKIFAVCLSCISCCDKLPLQNQSRRKDFIWLPFLAYCPFLQVKRYQGSRTLKQLVTSHPHSIPDNNALAYGACVFFFHSVQGPDKMGPETSRLGIVTSIYPIRKSLTIMSTVQQSLYNS